MEWKHEPLSSKCSRASVQSRHNSPPSVGNLNSEKADLNSLGRSAHARAKLLLSLNTRGRRPTASSGLVRRGLAGLDGNKLFSYVAAHVDLAISNLTKSFGQHRVLDGISLALSGSHAMVLIGPSGGGKSTLLRILAGLEKPDSGSVSINGQQLSDPSLRAYRSQIGVVFQAFNLFPHLTALENVTLPLEKVHKLPAKQAHERALEALLRFRLKEHLHKKPGQLSGGQKQRVAIARALSINPKLMLFDEPTSALDPEMTAEVLDILTELKQEGRDFVLVTHEMGFAREIADELILLSDGKILERGLSMFEHPQSEQARRFLERVLKY